MRALAQWERDDLVPWPRCWYIISESVSPGHYPFAATAITIASVPSYIPKFTAMRCPQLEHWCHCIVAGSHWLRAKLQNHHSGGCERIIRPIFSAHKTRRVFAPQSLPSCDQQFGLPVSARHSMLYNLLHSRVSTCYTHALTLAFLLPQYPDDPPLSKADIAFLFTEKRSGVRHQCQGWVYCTRKHGLIQTDVKLVRARFTVYLYTVFCLCISRVGLIVHVKS